MRSFKERIDVNAFCAITADCQDAIEGADDASVGRSGSESPEGSSSSAAGKTRASPTTKASRKADASTKSRKQAVSSHDDGEINNAVLAQNEASRSDDGSDMSSVYDAPVKRRKKNGGDTRESQSGSKRATKGGQVMPFLQRCRRR